MAKIMKANLWEVVADNQLAEPFRDVIGVERLAASLLANEIVLDVAFAQIGGDSLLLRAQLQQILLYRGNERQGAPAGIGLGSLLFHDSIILNNGVADRDGSIFEADILPTQTQCFAAAQSIECREQNDGIDGFVFRHIQQTVHLILIVEACHIFLLFGFYHTVGRIVGDHVEIHCVLQRFTDVGVYLQHCRGTQTLHDVRIIRLPPMRVLTSRLQTGQVVWQDGMENLFAEYGLMSNPGFRDCFFRKEASREWIMLMKIPQDYDNATPYMDEAFPGGLFAVASASFEVMDDTFLLLRDWANKSSDYTLDTGHEMIEEILPWDIVHKFNRYQQDVFVPIKLEMETN